MPRSTLDGTILADCEIKKSHHHHHHNHNGESTLSLEDTVDMATVHGLSWGDKPAEFVRSCFIDDVPVIDAGSLWIGDLPPVIDYFRLPIDLDDVDVQGNIGQQMSAQLYLATRESQKKAIDHIHATFAEAPAQSTSFVVLKISDSMK